MEDEALRPSESDLSARADLARLFAGSANGLAGAVRGVLGHRAEAAEVIQEAFLRALQALDAGSLPADPRAWIFVVTMNLAKDLRRRRMRRGPKPSLEEVNAMELRSLEPAPPAQVEHAETVALTRAAIQRLGDSEKEVLLLRISGELSFERIASALEIPVGTAKTRMRSALARLRQSLAPELKEWGASPSVEEPLR